MGICFSRGYYNFDTKTVQNYDSKSDAEKICKLAWVALETHSPFIKSEAAKVSQKEMAVFLSLT